MWWQARKHTFLSPLFRTTNILLHMKERSRNLMISKCLSLKRGVGSVCVQRSEACRPRDLGLPMLLVNKSPDLRGVPSSC